MNYLVFSSQTLTLKAKSVLENKGVIAEMVKTPEKYTKKGCSYSLKVVDVNTAIKVLGRAGIKVQAKY